MTLLSRFGGLAREVLVARIFGATALGSAFTAAFQIPNLFRRLFGEGALSAAFIPAYTAAMTPTEPGAASPDAPSPSDRLASLTLVTLGVVTSALTALAEIALLGVLVLGTNSADRELMLRLVMVMLPFMPLICTAAILAGMLQVHGRFGPASTGPLLLNAFIVTVAAYFLIAGQAAGPMIAYVLGAATVLSGATQCLWFLRLLRPHVRWTPDYRDAVPAARVMFRKFVPVAIGLGTLQLSTFLDTLICTYTIWAGPTLLGRPFPLDKESNVILAAGQRLYQFPLGVFGIAVATAVFPMLSRHALNWSAFRETLWRGVRLSLFIAVPASVGLVLVRDELSYVLYAGGNTGFSAAAVGRVAAVLLAYAPGVWIYSLNHVLSRAFYARGDTRTPMLVSIGMIAVNLSLTATMIWFIQERGLAWSTTITAGVQLAVLVILARRWRPAGAAASARTPASPTGSATARHATTRSIATTLLSAGVMFALVWAARSMLPAPTSWTGHLASLLVQTAVGGAAFVAAARALGSVELRELLGRSRSSAGSVD